MTAMGLARPDKSRGKPSSLLKNDEDYKQVFSASIDLEIYLWAARMQRRVDDFITSDATDTTIDQKSNLKFHLSMLIADFLNGAPIRNPAQLRNLARNGATPSDSELRELFEKLKNWADSYLKSEKVILERAAKSQRFSEYLIKKTAEERKKISS